MSGPMTACILQVSRNACGDTVIQVFHFRVQFPHFPDFADVLAQIVMHCLETCQDQLAVMIRWVDKVSRPRRAPLCHKITEGLVDEPNFILVVWHNNNGMETQESHANSAGLHLQQTAKCENSEGVIE